MARKIYVVDYGLDRNEALFSTGTHRHPFNAAKQFAYDNAPSSLMKIENGEETPLGEFWTCTDVHGITSVIEQ